MFFSFRFSEDLKTTAARHAKFSTHTQTTYLPIFGIKKLHITRTRKTLMHSTNLLYVQQVLHNNNNNNNNNNNVRCTNNLHQKLGFTSADRYIFYFSISAGSLKITSNNSKLIQQSYDKPSITTSRAGPTYLSTAVVTQTSAYMGRVRVNIRSFEKPHHGQ